ncbi:MAG: UDP-glucose/GDP-mannose dehydrogenase family protein [Candidatus Margulisbacteria bacterium]|nr:UDP-glucose/GDP-mannose dehydrogenase family protein [Candidatus Margulisiibacteriota bacterium]
MKICVIGTGYVGLTTGVCLAESGFDVTCIDKDVNKIRQLNEGEVPFHEPGLDSLLKKVMVGKKIKFSNKIESAIRSNDIIFIAVGTPSMEDGSADLAAVFEVAKSIKKNLNAFKILVIKSTVPVGTNKKVAAILAGRGGKSKTRFAVISNPEFLRQGKALADYKNPHRIVIGGTNQRAIDVIMKVYAGCHCPLIVTSPENAEIIKYASNSFLAMKISYINEVANICERYNADIREVAAGMGLDPRIGDRFLEAGIGFGGSCFPKDMKALVHFADLVDYDFKLLKAALAVNERQKLLPVEKLKKNLGSLRGRTIGLLGLSFKADTDDIREASSIALINCLLGEKVKVRVTDPRAEKNMKRLFPEINYFDSPYEMADGCDGLILITEWPEYSALDFKRIKPKLKKPLLIDGRNLFDPKTMKKLGFIYEGIGRN